MANAITTAGSLGCAHGGNATLQWTGKLKVNGKPVLLENQVTGLTIGATCSQKDASSGQVQCTAFLSFTGKATKLTVNGQAVVLDTFSGHTNGKPDDSTAPAGAGQSKLTAK